MKRARIFRGCDVSSRTVDKEFLSELMACRHRDEVFVFVGHWAKIDPQVRRVIESTAGGGYVFYLGYLAFFWLFVTGLEAGE